MSLKDKFDSLVKKASSIINEVYDWLGKPRWKNRIILYSVLGIVVIAISHYVFSYFGFLHTDTDSARYMLSALVQGEAAIVALAVTLSLVAVQLAAQSYSARVIEVFRKAPDLWILMFIYGVAIFYGLGVLKLINSDNISGFEIYISLAYYFGIFAFVALVPYMLKMFEMLKPSTVINMLAEKITKQNILAAIMEAEEKSGENDPIQPIIDIVRGSMMKFDYETVREGIRAIGDSTINIIKCGTFEDEKKERILKHISSHLTRLGKLAASREDEDSATEAITNLQKIGEAAAEQKLDVATEQVAESLGLIGKTSAEYRLKGLAMQTLSTLEAVGEGAVKNQLNVSAQHAVACLNWIGSTAAEQKLEDVTEWAAFYLEELGKVAAEYRFENTVEQVTAHLGLMGQVAVKNKFEKATLQTASSLERIGIAAAGKDLGNVTYNVAFSLKEVGIEAANYGNVKTLQHVQKCAEAVLNEAKHYELPEVPKIEEFFKIINEALSKSYQE